MKQIYFFRPFCCLMLLFFASSCSDSDKATSNEDSEIRIPAYEKGFSNLEISEFFATMNQVEFLARATLPEGMTDLLQLILIDIKRHTDSSDLPINEDRTSWETYQQILEDKMLRCVKKQKNRQYQNPTLHIQSGWLETVALGEWPTPVENVGIEPSQNTEEKEICELRGDWDSKWARSQITTHSTRSKGDQKILIDAKDAFSSEEHSAQSWDVVSLSSKDLGFLTDKDAVDRFNDYSQSHSNHIHRMTIGYQNGKSTSVEFGKKVNESSIWVDDVTQRKISTVSLVLVFKGLPNPIVYEKEISADSQNQTTYLTKINGEAIDSSEAGEEEGEKRESDF